MVGYIRRELEGIICPLDDVSLIFEGGDKEGVIYNYRRSLYVVYCPECGINYLELNEIKDEKSLLYILTQDFMTKIAMAHLKVLQEWNKVDNERIIKRTKAIKKGKDKGFI